MEAAFTDRWMDSCIGGHRDKEELAKGRVVAYWPLEPQTPISACRDIPGRWNTQNLACTPHERLHRFIHMQSISHSTGSGVNRLGPSTLNLHHLLFALVSLIRRSSHTKGFTATRWCHFSAVQLLSVICRAIVMLSSYSSFSGQACVEM